MRFAHRALRRLHDTDRAHGLPQDLVLRIRRIVFRFRDGKPVEVDLVDYH